MTPEHWKDVERLYHAAAPLEREQRSRFLATACSDAGVRREVETLLAHRDLGLSVLDGEAIDAAVEMMTGDAHALPGRTIGPYEILSLIGTGGMGVVYRARDTRLGRDVALKVLPDALAHDPDRVVRSEREARVLASLNHPNIAAIYDLHETDGMQWLVLELVEGETLADRLKRGPLSESEGLGICRQIAEALEAAHAHGIVHRDLKPANVMITPAGSVKVLDFGLARMLSADDSPRSPSASTSGSHSVRLGTPFYMSPEQARGQPTDTRADIWAFGCVLYEVLTGTRAFAKETPAETLAAVIEREPDWSLLPRSTSPALEDLLRLCLHKDALWRLRDIGDARIGLARAQSRPSIAPRAPERGRPNWRPRMVWGTAIAMLGLVAMALWLARASLRQPASPAEMRVEITTPPTTDPVAFAISPDGRTLVFVAAHDGRARLWLRSLDAVSSRPLDNTDRASCPFWSPTGASVGFFADGWLRRVDVDTGVVRDVVGALSCGGTWNRDDTILFSAPLYGPISRVSAAGDKSGRRSDVTARTAGHGSHRFPQFLPDGRHFLYYVAGRADIRGIYVGDLEGSAPRRLLDADTAAAYVSSGHVLFARRGTLLAQAFDPERLTTSGNPFPIAEQVAFDPTKYIAAVSASSAGVIVYRSGLSSGTRQFVWFDRSGRELERVGPPDSTNPLDPSLAPDGYRVALNRTLNGESSIWLLDTRRGVSSRFTSEVRIRPLWAPDGKQIAFAARGSRGYTDLFVQSATGASQRDLLLETDQPKAVTDWSRDGRFLLYRSADPKMGWDLWALPLDATRQPFPVVRTGFDERDAQFSPDGKWIAYQSNESGRFEIYVQPFPGPGDKVTVSTSGGAQVRWRQDGTELFYMSLDDQLMVVPVEIAAKSQHINVGTPIPLFRTESTGAVQSANRQQYMVTADGQRFLINTVVPSTTAPIVMLLNWKPNAR
jgi:Tol biopolymer transport system component